APAIVDRGAALYRFVAQVCVELVAANGPCNQPVGAPAWTVAEFRQPASVPERNRHAWRVEPAQRVRLNANHAQRVEPVHAQREKRSDTVGVTLERFMDISVNACLAQCDRARRSGDSATRNQYLHRNAPSAQSMV